MTNKQQVNMNVVDGGSMFAHELTVNFTPLQFMLDFKNITPRSDPRSKGRPSFTLRHNVVMVDPWQAKQMITVLKNVVKKYEEQFGKISKPKALVKAQKMQNNNEKSQESNDVPSYFG